MTSLVSLPRVHVPINRPEDVIPHLGSPTHWQPGRSAKCVADSWFGSNAIPASVTAVLDGDPVFRSATLLDAFLERGVDLGDGARPSQTDLMAIVGLEDGIGILAVEAKVDEPFGPTVREWLQAKDRDASQKSERLASLCALLGLKAADVGQLRYQLLHRTASAVLEARRYRAGHAAMLVQSFCPKGSWHGDFAAFASAMGMGEVHRGSISAPRDCGGVQLRVGWVSDPVVGPFVRLKTPRTVKSLTELGRERLSKSFFMRDMLYSEVAAIHGLNNAPDDPQLALAAGRGLCEMLLEPLQDHWGRIAIRSAYRSCEVNGFCNEMQRAGKAGYTCASNEANYASHIWDRRDADGFMGATACVVVPSFWEAHRSPGDWRMLARWIHENLPHAGLFFFPTYWAFNISWSENPMAARTINSYAEPKGLWVPK
ncbi:DUF6946 family protein [Sandarakinorhabdus rubra]|uniref:DUF6946 family protein n=1 Tax=Sandarakinorhabdus rubra TaxID=2672568 RepID=UPI0013DCD6EF|nr:hypothetical protein [Sandarakinorhabdus rubra]